MVNGQWSTVNGQWSMVNSQWPKVKKINPASLAPAGLSPKKPNQTFYFLIEN